jgi:hypothetical protein
MTRAFLGETEMSGGPATTVRFGIYHNDGGNNIMEYGLKSQIVWQKNRWPFISMISQPRCRKMAGLLPCRGDRRNVSWIGLPRRRRMLRSFIPPFSILWGSDPRPDNGCISFSGRRKRGLPLPAFLRSIIEGLLTGTGQIRPSGKAGLRMPRNPGGTSRRASARCSP